MTGNLISQSSITQSSPHISCAFIWMSSMSLVSDPFKPDTDVWIYFSLCRNTDEFDKADDLKKRTHFNSLLTLRCITHVLPLLRKDEIILLLISYKSFHGTWKLDGWNDHIIQPARDVVLDYYKVCTHNISSVHPSRLKPMQSISFSFSATQSHLTLKNTCVAIIYSRFFSCFIVLQ